MVYREKMIPKYWQDNIDFFLSYIKNKITL